jgi:type IV pilus biogenesis protein CpaD/CtpE
MLKLPPRRHRTQRDTVPTDLEYSIGRIETLLETQGETIARLESSLSSMRTDTKAQLADLEKRVRTMEDQNIRISVWSGVGSSVGMAAIIETIRHWIK